MCWDCMHLQAAAAVGAAVAILAGEGSDSSLCSESRTSQAFSQAIWMVFGVCLSERAGSPRTS